ncbi:MAG: hypothetical protein QXS91_00260 [Candidatus Anstonellales archaeon]
MRLLEVSLITLATFSIIASIQMPVIETSYYEQQYMLANDLFIHLYKETKGTLYYEQSYDQVLSIINNASAEIGLCIYFENNYYRIKNCDIKYGAFIRSDQPYGYVIIGVGK